MFLLRLKRWWKEITQAPINLNTMHERFEQGKQELDSLKPIRLAGE